MAEQAHPELRNVFLTGEAKGYERKIEGIDVYISEPPRISAARTGIIFIANYRGWKSKEIRLYADKFAIQGHHCSVPDLFKGDEPPLKEMKEGDYRAYEEWAQRHTEEGVLSDVDKLLTALKQQFSLTKFGAVGFCWGALHSALLSTKPDKVNAAVLYNPSRGFRPKIFEDNRQPMLILGAEKDEIMPPSELERYQTILSQKTVPFDVQVFPGEAHGWTTAQSPKSVANQMAAFQKAADWFLKYL